MKEKAPMTEYGDAPRTTKSERRAQFKEGLRRNVYETEHEKMPELTRLAHSETVPLSTLVMLEKQLRPIIDFQLEQAGVLGQPAYIYHLPTEEYRHSFYQHRRSEEGTGNLLRKSTDLIEGEIAAEGLEKEELAARGDTFT